MFGVFCRYNEVMNDKEIYNTPNSSCCGRPFPVATESKCNWSCGPVSEYCGCSLGRIKKDADLCKSCCVIPSITAETTDGITNLANCLVHVTSINTTFYIDDKHRPMITWAGPVEIANYDIEANELNLRSQTCYTTVNDVYTEVYFDKQGVGHIMGTEV